MSKSSVSESVFSRRQFVSSSVASGFACAVMPALGSTILSTDSDGLDAGEKTFVSGDITLMAYCAKPKNRQQLPVVIVVQEIFGLHEHIRDLCRRLAKEGYFAVAPNLYQRQGDPMRIADINKLVTDIVRQVPDAQVMSDLDATLNWAVAHGGDAKKVAITGFCWGGRITWLYAAHRQINAAVAWYGRLQSAPTALQPQSPLDIAAQIKCPVLGLYGGADEGIPASSIELMRDALKQNNIRAEIIVYPDTPHGFNADYRESYRPQMAQDGWQRMLAWFRANGVS